MSPALHDHFLEENHEFQRFLTWPFSTEWAVQLVSSID
jgi:hypothetical protein